MGNALVQAEIVKIIEIEGVIRTRDKCVSFW